MQADELRKFLKAAPFEPLRLALSDGRSVIIHHPDQVVVSHRHIYIGLAKVGRSRPLETPRKVDAIASDWIWLNLLQVVAVEPLDGRSGARSKRRGRRLS